MERNWTLIREIMFEIEKKDSPFPDRLLEIDGRTGYEIGYHVKLLYESGLIDEVHDFAGDVAAGYLLAPGGLTSQGHDFLDNIRQGPVWKQVLDRIAAVGGKVSLPVLTTVAKEIAVTVMKSTSCGSP
ncbi:MAG: DUF2513 domain-containing protein [Acidobacteria bacterium]|nr:DUF2513 domain-containing protein [Acidobacteriota bacterium]